MSNVKKSSVKKNKSMASVGKISQGPGKKSKKSKQMDKEESAQDQESRNDISEKIQSPNTIQPRNALVDHEQASENFETSALLDMVPPDNLSQDLIEQTDFLRQDQVQMSETKIDAFDNKSQDFDEDVLEMSVNIDQYLEEKEKVDTLLVDEEKISHEEEFFGYRNEEDIIESRVINNQEIEEIDLFGIEDDLDIDLESVRALTLKDGLDYENQFQGVFIPDLKQPKKKNPVDELQKNIILVQESWVKIEKIGLDISGEILMKNIFKLAPAALQLFSFRDEPLLYESESFKSHSLKVISTVGVAVKGLVDLEKLVPILKDLGKMHVYKGVLPEHYPIVGKALIMTLKEGLKTEWNNKLDTAWTAIYQIVQDTMIGTNYEDFELEKNILLVQDSWIKVEKLGLDIAGQTVMKNIFELAPAALQLFSFRDEPSLYESESFKSHSLKVISTVGVAVKGLDDLEKLVPILKNLGRMHVGKGVLPEHYPIVGQALIMALKEGLDSEWNNELEKAWTVIYQIVQDTMIGKNYEDLELLKNIILVQNSWVKVEKLGLDISGQKLMKNIFELAPAALQLFSFRDEPLLYESESFKSHSLKVISTVGVAVKGLEDLEKLVPILVDLGKMHVGKGVLPVHYPVVGQALIMTLKEGLDTEWNNELEKAWTVIYQIVQDTMIGTNYEDFNIKNKTSPILDENNPEVKDETIQNIKNDYMLKFRKEVDFHHKVAYRFEKSYRLSKNHPEKRETLNEEIVDIIMEHSNYIEQDPMALFYCLYFCIYYKNSDMVEFLRALISKIQNRPVRINQLLDYIDTHGIERIRTVGESINTHVYHMTFYQAVDDDLRVVFAQIMRQLKFIQLRDKDALHLLRQRDYDLIRLSFTKSVVKLKMSNFYKETFTMKSQTYRQYNQAFFEEILIDFSVEQRVAQNYRERFLVTPEDIYLVLSMYAKNDYVNYFLRLNLEEISHTQFIELFEISIKNDAFKVGLQIYMRFLTNNDMNFKMMDLFIMSLKDSLKYHEFKLFFLHEYFDVMNISQLNQLVDTYMEILHKKEIKANPVLSQFNTIKYSLLIYRISWKIEKKKIYSLITKCSVLNKYIMDSLTNYLSKQQHISQLYKFMREPIFHMTEKKDSLDIMLEMNMNVLLQNPVIVEVLNLVYEGKYSVDPSATNLSQTLQSFFLMGISDLKSINGRLWQNIRSFGEQGNSLQSSLQFNIWKQCIEQREIDEMRFTVLICAVVMFLGFYLDLVISNFVKHMSHLYTQQFISQPHVFINADPEILHEFCPVAKNDLLVISQIVNYFYVFIIVSAICYITSIVQKIAVFKLNDNVEIKFQELMIEAAIAITSISFVVLVRQDKRNPLIADICGNRIEISENEKHDMDFVYALLAQTSNLNFQLIVSLLILLYVSIMIMMLQRTQNFGELIMMVGQMVNELKKFFFAFGLIILLFIILGNQLDFYLKIDKTTMFGVVQDIFDGLNGQQNFEKYRNPQGFIFITLFVFLFRILLLSFLVAMFINRYKFVYRNLDALRRMNIIKLKNSASYDKIYSSITITFFPISIILLPFIPAVILFKSERLNDFILKIQYTIMMLMYAFLACIIFVPILPMLYVKSVANAIYIMLHNKREKYKGQNIVELISTTLLNPLLVLISFFVDLISMPALLMKDERGFEFKYQQALEILNKTQVGVIMTTFAKIFYINFKQLYGDKGMTLIELMEMHTEIFKIIDNLHDLCCRGTKDHKQALANVQDYNMTKILTRKCSIPDISGDIKLSRCEFNILYNVQMDIELYNYFEILMRDYRQGQLTRDNLEKDRIKFFKQEESTDKQAFKLNSGISFLTLEMQPPGITFKRDNSDVMNNFFINLAATSYTNIEELLRASDDKDNNKAIKSTMNELNITEKVWKGKIQSQVDGIYKSFTDEMQINNKVNEVVEVELKQKQMEESKTSMPQMNGSKLNELEEIIFM